MNRAVIFELSQLLGAADDPQRTSPLRAELDTLAERYGRSEPSEYVGLPERARAAAEQAIASAGETERELVWAQQLLPEAESRLAQAQKSANGRWILLGALVLIALAVVIGQAM